MAPKVFIMKCSPPCRAVLMVAQAIGLELEIQEVDKEELKTPEMLEINPQHTVPILVDEDFTLWDSHAIIGYLVEQYGENHDSLYPKDDIKKRAVIDQRLHFENGILYTRCREAVIPLFMGETEIEEDTKDKLIEALGFLDIFLGENDWFCGDEVTIADLSLLATIATVELFIPVDAERFPHLNAWLTRAKDLPYFHECNHEGLQMFKEMMPNAVPFEA